MKRLRKLFDSKKLNNKGMSLIEILVAVVILSVASVILLRGFASAALYNQNAAVKQHSLTLAQSLMESMKSYSIDTLDTQFGSVTNADFKIYALESSSTKSKSASGEERTYTLRGVKCNELWYDAKIMVKPYTHTPVTGDPAVTVQNELVSITNPNKYHDAIFKQQETADFDYFQPIVQSAILAADATAVPNGAATLNATNTTIASRDMVMTITANTVDVNVTYTYTVTDLDYQVIDPTTGAQVLSTTPYSGSFSTTVNFRTEYGQEYNNDATGATLENIYFYYYPMYMNSAFLNCASDNLSVENNSGSTKTLYLIKQESDQFAYETDFILAENNYDLNLSCTGSTINLYHNVNESIPGGGSPDVLLSGSITDNGSPWRANVAVKPLMYEITVNVYEKDSADSICELKGSTNIQ